MEPGFVIFWIGIFLYISVNAFLNRKTRRTKTFGTSYSEPNRTALDLFLHHKAQYLKSTVWKEKRLKRLHLDNYTCQSCRAVDIPLEVHHTTGYKDIPNESVTCLVSLCRDCHELQHTIHGFPRTLEDYHKWNAPLVKKT